ncbi:MAG: helix-turn-helix transcriptional regulator [Ruminococcus sp.]|nr:helix-turn-helix transcriptional regulator [Ruminococcus sp.]
MFWDNFQRLCEERETKPTVVMKALNISTGSAKNWKKGTVPNGETLKHIADYLNVSIEYLIYDDEISIRPSVKKRRQNFNSMYAIVQRWESLRQGDDVEVEKILGIMKYVNCSLYFISNIGMTEYVPEKICDDKVTENQEILFDVLDIMDVCADSDSFRALQIQLSRVVLYHLKNKGYTEERLAECCGIDRDKLRFLYSGVPHRDVTKNYGLNYSDLAVIRRVSGLSYRYMFTGN